MAVTIQLQPSTPNISGTNLVYTLLSTKSSLPQFRYVIDIYESGSSNYITTLKTYPNLHSVGNIDVARTLGDYLNTQEDWKNIVNPSSGSIMKTFDLRFGEEYSNNYSEATTIYTGSTPNYLSIFPGDLDPRYKDGYNFLSSRFAGPLSGYDSADTNLTNDPLKLNAERWIYPYAAKPIGKDDYETDYYLNRINGNYISSVGVKLYDSNLVFSASYQDTYTGSLQNDLYTIGTGPKNIGAQHSAFSSSFASGDWSYYEIKIGYNNEQADEIYKAYINEELSEDAISSTPYLTTLPQNGCNLKTRFAFINKFGVWDYYSIFNPVSRNTGVDKKTYTKVSVGYQNEIALYDASNRGEKQYQTSYTDDYSVNTDYLDENMSQWIQELLESPNVFIQEGDDFIPIIITNSSYRVNNNSERNKLSQYIISFKYSNKRIKR